MREKAKQLVTLLKDDERLRNERARALKAKERFAQTASAFGSDTGLVCIFFISVHSKTRINTFKWFTISMFYEISKIFTFPCFGFGCETVNRVTD